MWAAVAAAAARQLVMGGPWRGNCFPTHTFPLFKSRMKASGRLQAAHFKGERALHLAQYSSVLRHVGAVGPRISDSIPELQ